MLTQPSSAHPDDTPVTLRRATNPRRWDAESRTDRRIAHRYRARFAAHLSRTTTVEKRTGFVVDISVAGALFLTRAKVAVDDCLEVELFMYPDTTKARVVRGRVVRVQELEPRGYWNRKAAVAFEGTIVDAEPILAQIERRQNSVRAPTAT